MELTAFFKYILVSKLIVVLSIVSISLNAQTYYPVDSNYISVLSEKQKATGQSFKSIPIDSTINNFQNYFQRNSNGNLGLASTPLLFQYDAKALGFMLYDMPYQNDVIQTNQVNYYQTKSPYASLTGIAGSKQEQVFKFLFSNSFKNKLNISLAFNRYSGNGFYKRQQSFTNNFYTTSHYTSKNKRFGYYAYALLNKIKHQENGGVKNDSLLLADISISKQLVPLNLSNAKREWRDFHANADMWFRLNKLQDSASKFSHTLHYKPSYLSFYSVYNDKGDTTDKYYAISYLDTLHTKDSTHWRRFANDINYSLHVIPLNLTLDVGFKNEYNQLYQYGHSDFSNNLVYASASLLRNKYQGYLSAQSILSGSNANDYQIALTNHYWSSIFSEQKIKFQFNANYESRHPDYIYNQWFSNHYQWTNSFSPTQKLQGLISAQIPQQEFEVGAIVQQINNALYFSEQAMPIQTNSGIQNLNVFVKKNTLLFKHLGINAQYNFQHSSYQAITSLPNHVINGALYYQGNLFKRALQLQLGIHATYYSSFNGMAYMPATNVYYTQSQQMVGDYPYLDFFLNARIKPVRVFIKIDHFNQGFMGRHYDLAPNYWQNDRAFKFGINWLFFD